MSQGGVAAFFTAQADLLSEVCERVWTDEDRCGVRRATVFIFERLSHRLY